MSLHFSISYCIFSPFVKSCYNTGKQDRFSDFHMDRAILDGQEMGKVHKSIMYSCHISILSYNILARSAATLGMLVGLNPRWDGSSLSILRRLISFHKIESIAFALDFSCQVYIGPFLTIFSSPYVTSLKPCECCLFVRFGTSYYMWSNESG